MMFKPTIHLCLVHNTATANVTPALDPDFKPQEVIWVQSLYYDIKIEKLWTDMIFLD